MGVIIKSSSLLIGLSKFHNFTSQLQKNFATLYPLPHPLPHTSFPTISCMDMKQIRKNIYGTFLDICRRMKGPLKLYIPFRRQKIVPSARHVACTTQPAMYEARFSHNSVFAKTEFFLPGLCKNPVFVTRFVQKPVFLTRFVQKPGFSIWVFPKTGFIIEKTWLPIKTRFLQQSGFSY